LITINRRLASRLRAVFRRAFGAHGPGPAVSFIADAGTLSVRASSRDIAVEYRTADDGAAETLCLPFQAILDFEGKKDEPVRIETAGNGRVTAQWTDRGVPQIVHYDACEPKDWDSFPGPPERFDQNPASLLGAFHEAAETTDPGSVRYALGHVQLQGKSGTLAATDGRELLLQSGFVFPWEEDLLVPRTRLLGSPEFRTDQPVEVGKAGDWVAFRTGDWTIWLVINKDGRFPNVSQIVPKLTDATVTCRLSSSDARFLAETLPRLPSDDQMNHPVTVDVNGSVVIRAKPADQDRVTELVLRNSSWSGEPLRINTNRRYLVRAMKLGFQEVHLCGLNAPILCQDGNRQYLWMVLDPESALPPAKDPIRIESPTTGAVTAIPQPKPQRNVPTVNETTPNANGNGQAHTNGHTASDGRATRTNGRVRQTKAAQQDIAALIEQATKLRTALHDLLCQAGGLVKALKQHRRQNRAIQNTLASLKQLKTLGV
jgi:hypothetical protein